MVGAVIQRYLDIHHIEACQYTGEHSALDTLFRRADIFLRDRAANDSIDKLITLLRIRLNADLDMAILAAAAGRRLPS